MTKKIAIKKVATKKTAAKKTTSKKTAARKKTTAKSDSIYQIKVTLRYIKPAIWRRILVKADTRLGKLHEILQDVMGWGFEHLHAFNTKEESYGPVDPDFTTDMANERYVRLDKIAGLGSKFIYEYDFGDGWEHEIKIEKVMPYTTAIQCPICLDGQRACPPEDCGGPDGYERLLNILKNPRDEEYPELIEWLGEDFDPEAFDVYAVNRHLS